MPVHRRYAVTLPGPVGAHARPTVLLVHLSDDVPPGGGYIWTDASGRWRVRIDGEVATVLSALPEWTGDHPLHAVRCPDRLPAGGCLPVPSAPLVRRPGAGQPGESEARAGDGPGGCEIVPVERASAAAALWQLPQAGQRGEPGVLGAIVMSAVSRPQKVRGPHVPDGPAGAWCTRRTGVSGSAGVWSDPGIRTLAGVSVSSTATVSMPPR